jgi:hypothetical protein
MPKTSTTLHMRLIKHDGKMTSRRSLAARATVGPVCLSWPSSDEAVSESYGGERTSPYNFGGSCAGSMSMSGSVGRTLRVGFRGLAFQIWRCSKVGELTVLALMAFGVAGRGIGVLWHSRHCSRVVGVGYMELCCARQLL